MQPEHEIVDEAVWLAARLEFLEKEKDFTRARDELNAARRELPWLAVVSRAPLDKLQAFAGRMGWRFPWYSSAGSDFNYDFKVSFTEEEIATGTVDYNFRQSSFTPAEAPGLSVFYRDGEANIYRTYSCYARGLDMLNAAYHHLDLVPSGRDEAGLPFSMAWLDFQDSYSRGGAGDE